MAQIATHIPFKYVRRVKITLAYFTVTVIGLLRAYLCTSRPSMSTSLHVVHCSSIPSLSIVGFDVALMQLSEQRLSEQRLSE